MLDDRGPIGDQKTDIATYPILKDLFDVIDGGSMFVILGFGVCKCRQRFWHEYEAITGLDSG